MRREEEKRDSKNRPCVFVVGYVPHSNDSWPVGSLQIAHMPESPLPSYVFSTRAKLGVGGGKTVCFFSLVSFV